MKKVTKPVGTRETQYGNVTFPIYESLDELVAAFGKDSVLKLGQRALTIDLERIARDAFKAGKPAEEVQAGIDGYKPGGRASAKPTLKSLMAKLQTLGEAAKKDPKKVDILVKAGQLYNSDGVEAAYNFLTEQGF